MRRPCQTPLALALTLTLGAGAGACSDDAGGEEAGESADGSGDLSGDSGADEVEESAGSSDSSAGESSSESEESEESSTETAESEESSTETADAEESSTETADAEESSSEDSSSGTGEELAPWLVNIENLEDNSVHQLNRISIAPGEVGAKTVVCADITFPQSLPQTGNIVSSLTFNDYDLYAVAERDVPGDTIIQINPCDCSAAEVGQFNQGESYVGALTSTGAGEMFAISSQPDWLFAVDPETAMTTLLSVLGDDWGTSGLTWAGDRGQTLWAISGVHDTLFEFSSDDGMELSATPLSWDFGSVGMEYHPGVDTLYACTGTGELLGVDVETGDVEVLGDPQIQQCNNIAAPFGPVECIPQ